MISTALGLVLIVSLSGCASPFGVNQLDATESYQQTNGSALTSDAPSGVSLNVLRRYGLLALWRSNPNAAIAALRADVVIQPRLWRELFTLAELSYLQGKRDISEQDFLAAALYAYAYIEPGGTVDQPSPFDRQFQQACDMYNLGLTWALTPPDKGPLSIVSSAHDLPFGHIGLTADPREMKRSGGELISFQSTANLQPRGLTNVYSTPGLGDALAAEVYRGGAQDQALYMAPNLRVPANLLMVIDHPRQQIAQSELSGNLIVHTIYDQQDVYFGHEPVALAYDQSATLALSLSPTPSRIKGLLIFLAGRNNLGQKSASDRAGAPSAWPYAGDPHPWHDLERRHMG